MQAEFDGTVRTDYEQAVTDNEVSVSLSGLVNTFWGSLALRAVFRAA